MGGLPTGPRHPCRGSECYCWLTAIVVTCGGCELEMLLNWTTTCTSGPGATKSGILTSICQTPTCPGANPENTMHVAGLQSVESSINREPMNTLSPCGGPATGSVGAWPSGGA